MEDLKVESFAMEDLKVESSMEDLLVGLSMEDLKVKSSMNSGNGLQIINPDSLYQKTFFRIWL